MKIRKKVDVFFYVMVSIFLSVLWNGNTVKANPNVYFVVTDPDPVGGGSTLGNGNYAVGDLVTLRASVNEDYVFKGWFTRNGFLISSKPTYYFTVTENMSGTGLYIAKFAKKHKVYFETLGGTTVATQKVEHGLHAVPPRTPEREGYIFLGWYIDTHGNQPFDFSKGIEYDISLYANWAIDYSKLQEKVNQATKKMNPATYTEQSICVLREAVHNANVMLSEHTAKSPSDVTDMIQKITYAERGLNSYFVRFKDVAGNLLLQTSTSMEIKPPTPVSYENYEFLGWKEDGVKEVYKGSFHEVGHDTVFYPYYKLIAQKEYQLEVDNGSIVWANGKKKIQCEFGSEILVEADPAPEGMKFAYWTMNHSNAPIYYYRVYGFVMGRDTILKAVYVSEDQEVVPEPVIYGYVQNKDSVLRTESFAVQRSLPAGYQDVDLGIIATDNQSFAMDINANEKFVIGASEVKYQRSIKQSGQDNEITGSFLWKKKEVTKDWYVRGFLKYIDKQGKEEIIYTDVIS